MLIRNLPGQGFGVDLVDRLTGDPVTPPTTVTVEVKVGNGAVLSGPAAGTLAHVADSWWHFTPTPAATDADLITVRLSVAGKTAFLAPLRTERQVVAAFGAGAVEQALSRDQALRLLLAFVAGEAAGADGTVRFRDLADTKDRLVMTVDAQGNRSMVVRDPT